MRRIPVLPLLLSAVLLTGCLSASQAGRSTETPAGAQSGPKRVSNKSTSGGVPESTVGASRFDGDLTGAIEVPSGVSFAGTSEDGGGSGYDADTVLAVRYGTQGEFERAVIDLGAGKTPAGTVPEWNLTSQEGDGLLRVDLPSANATCVSDGGFGGGLLGSFHVVRAPDGGMLVDFFARQPFRYRAFGLEDPARLVVDFEPAGSNLNVTPPSEGGDTVLLEPRPNANISDPLTVSGYSRNPEAANTITLINPRERVLARRTVQSNDWNHTWGYFEATIDLPPFSGRANLRVGAGNARDGSFDGVEIPVRAGR